jgi:pyruvate formate lyase activating enzyme
MPPALRVGGLQPFTSIDYPGELAAVVFCQGCPWRCHYCQNPQLLVARGTQEIPWPQVAGFLSQRRGLLDAVVFSGGEPTLQPGLAQAMNETRGLGFKIGLHTAGCYPRRLQVLLPLLDWIGLDIKALPEDYPRLTGMANSGAGAWDSLQQVLACPGLNYEIRVTLEPELLHGGRLTQLIDRLEQAGVRHLALQACPLPTGPPLSPPWVRIETLYAGRFETLACRSLTI